MNSVCNSSQLWRESITGSTFAACVVVNKRLSVEFPNAFDDYNVIGDICISSGESQLAVPSYPFRPKFQVSSSTQSLQAALDQTVSSLCVTLCAICFTFGFNIAVGLFLFSVHAEWCWEHRCLCARKIIPIFEQERCARSSSCSACRSHQMDRLQQVIILSASKQIAFLILQVPSYLFFPCFEMKIGRFNRLCHFLFFVVWWIMIGETSRNLQSILWAHWSVQAFGS